MEKTQFIAAIEEAIDNDSLVRITLSKPTEKDSDLNKIRIKLAVIKGVLNWSFVYNHSRKDTTKNYSIEEGLQKIQAALPDTFKIATLFTTKHDISYQFNKKGKPSFHKRAPTFSVVPPRTHDKNKATQTTQTGYLQDLGVLTAKGHPQKGKGDKYKQINKFVEVMSALIKQQPTLQEKDTLHVVDMGSGKGYLTFALYDFLTNQLNKKAIVTGVEIRPDLVSICNEIAEKNAMENLQFQQGFIGDYSLQKTDILIALHACDTATDDAIAKGIKANADLIVCAPCCHKQIRKQMNVTTHLNSITQHGILKERLAEMVTDTMRAQMLELNDYRTKVFEFISTDHTGKNVMVVGQKDVISDQRKKEIHKSITDLKKEFGIDFHYLEKLLSVHI